MKDASPPTTGENAHQVGVLNLETRRTMEAGVHQAEREHGETILCLRFLIDGSHAYAAESRVYREDG